MDFDNLLIYNAHLFWHFPIVARFPIAIGTGWEMSREMVILFLVDTGFVMLRNETSHTWVI